MVNEKSKSENKTYVTEEVWKNTKETRKEVATSSDGMERTVTVITRGADDQGLYVLKTDYQYNLNQTGSLIKTGLRTFAQSKANEAIKFAGGNKTNSRAGGRGVGYYFVNRLCKITGDSKHDKTQAHCHEGANVVVYDYLNTKRNFSSDTLKKILPLKFSSVDGKDWAEKNGVWHKFIKGTGFGEYTPKPGDLLIFKKVENSNTATHTELVIGYSKNNAVIYTYNFNSGSKIETGKDNKTLKKNTISIKTGKKNSTHYILGVIEVRYLSH